MLPAGAPSAAHPESPVGAPRLRGEVSSVGQATESIPTGLTREGLSQEGTRKPAEVTGRQESRWKKDEPWSWGFGRAPRVPTAHFLPDQLGLAIEEGQGHTMQVQGSP